VQPKVLFFENVKGFEVAFKGKDKKPASKKVIEELKKMGYKDAMYEILNFSKFGIPQSRKRVIIIATKKGNAKDFFIFLKKQSSKVLRKRGLKNSVTLEEAISDLCKKGEIN